MPLTICSQIVLLRLRDITAIFWYCSCYFSVRMVTCWEMWRENLCKIDFVLICLLIYFHFCCPVRFFVTKNLNRNKNIIKNAFYYVNIVQKEKHLCRIRLDLKAAHLFIKDIVPHVGKHLFSFLSQELDEKNKYHSVQILPAVLASYILS